MKTIKNNTDHVITVSNGYFFKDIAIGETISVTDQEINKNYVFQFKFFSLKEKTENKMEVIRTVGNQIGLWFTSTSYIPLQTEFDVESYHEIILMTQSMDIVFLTKLFKKICLLSPLMENFPLKPVYNFPTLNCKKKLMFSLGVELLVTIPIFLILLYSCFVSYLELWGWFECISITFLTLYLGFSNTRKLYYLLFKFKKQKNLTLN